jgi:hypothetical protein
MSLFLLGGMVGTAIAQVAMPATADFPCWMMDAGGQVIDMSYLCQTAQPDVAATAEAPVEGDVAILPMAGRVCADFATQGEAQYHYLLGTAPATMDGDNDGVACEASSRTNRSGGSRVNSYRSTRYAGVDIELFDVGRRNMGGDFYLRVTAPELGIFTTRSFANKTDAIEHVRTYYGYTQGL